MEDKDIAVEIDGREILLSLEEAAALHSALGTYLAANFDGENFEISTDVNLDEWCEED